ncbi:DUF4384 domain-containing protein [Candidatus Bipolaricaulota bacterium]
MNRKLLLALLIVGCSIAGTSTLVAQTFPLGLLPVSPDSGDPLSAFVWTMDSVFEIGDPIEIHLAVSRAAFVYLFDLQPDGLVRMLFPNAYSVNNYLTTSVVLPDGGYQLTAFPPTGIEELLVFASTNPLPITLGTPTDPFPLLAASPEAAIDQLVTLLASIDPTTTWAVGWMAIQITGDLEPEPIEEEPVLVTAPPPLPPFAGLPGDAWYIVDSGWHSGFPTEGWYWYFGLESRWHLSWVWF